MNVLSTFGDQKPYKMILKVAFVSKSVTFSENACANIKETQTSAKTHYVSYRK